MRFCGTSQVGVQINLTNDIIDATLRRMFMIPTYYLETDSGVSGDVYRTIEEQVLFRNSYPQIVAEFDTEQENKKVKTKSMQPTIKKLKTLVCKNSGLLRTF